MTRFMSLLVGCALALAAHAHTPLKSSVPAADSALAAPQVLELTFGGDVRLTSVTLSDSSGAAKHLDDVPTAIASTFSLAVHEPLAPGAYKVVWRAVGGDTHIITGEFAFTVIAAHAH